MGDSSKISKKPILLIDHFKYKLNHTILPHINHLQNTHSRNFITSNMHVRLYTLKCTSDYFMFNVLVNILYRDIYVCVTKQVAILLAHTNRTYGDGDSFMCGKVFKSLAGLIGCTLSLRKRPYMESLLFLMAMFSASGRVRLAGRTSSQPLDKKHPNESKASSQDVRAQVKMISQLWGKNIFPALPPTNQ